MQVLGLADSSAEMAMWHGVWASALITALLLVMPGVEVSLAP